MHNSIKAAERKTCGENRTVIIKSTKSKLSADFQSFLKNNDSKTRIINLRLDYIIKHKTKVLDILRCMDFFFKYNPCQSISLSLVNNVLYLSCEQEEADTRIFRRCQYILNIQKDAHTVIRSPWSDTDIIIIGVSLLNSDYIFTDNGTGKNRNCLQIDKMKIHDQKKEALIGFHAITGNDYILSFFGKGKCNCWKKLCQKISLWEL